MKVIIEQYSAAILAVAIAILLLGGCVQNPLFEGVAKQLLWCAKEVEHGGAFNEKMSACVPTIVLEDAYALKAGKEVEIDTMFAGYSKEANNIPINIYKIYNENFEEMSNVLSTENGTICIEKPGIYWVKLEITNVVEKPFEAVVKVFVNGSEK